MLVRYVSCTTYPGAPVILITPIKTPVSTPVSEKSTSVTRLGPVYTLIGCVGVPMTSILSESSFQPGACINTFMRSVQPSPSYLSLQSCNTNTSFEQNFIITPVVFLTTVKPVSAAMGCRTAARTAAPTIKVTTATTLADLIDNCSRVTCKLR